MGEDEKRGGERIRGHGRVAGAERRERVGIDTGIVGEVAAAPRDDGRAGNPAAAGETIGDAVVIGRAAGREQHRPVRREQAFGIDCLGGIAEEVEEGVDRAGIGEDALEALDAAERQPRLGGGPCHGKRLVEGSAAGPAAHRAHFDEAIDAVERAGSAGRLPQAAATPSIESIRQ